MRHCSLVPLVISCVLLFLAGCGDADSQAKVAVPEKAIKSDGIQGRSRHPEGYPPSSPVTQRLTKMSACPLKVPDRHLIASRKEIGLKRARL